MASLIFTNARVQGFLVRGLVEGFKKHYFSANYDPSVVAIKMYQRPWEFNITEREIIDTAMGNVNVGPMVYKFLETGKIEQDRNEPTYSCFKMNDSKI